LCGSRDDKLGLDPIGTCETGGTGQSGYVTISAGRRRSTGCDQARTRGHAHGRTNDTPRALASRSGFTRRFEGSLRDLSRAIGATARQQQLGNVARPLAVLAHRRVREQRGDHVEGAVVAMYRQAGRREASQLGRWCEREDRVGGRPIDRDIITATAREPHALELDDIDEPGLLTAELAEQREQAIDTCVASADRERARDLALGLVSALELAAPQIRGACRAACGPIDREGIGLGCKRAQELQGGQREATARREQTGDPLAPGFAAEHRLAQRSERAAVKQWRTIDDQLVAVSHNGEPTRVDIRHHHDRVLELETAERGEPGGCAWVAGQLADDQRFDLGCRARDCIEPAVAIGLEAARARRDAEPGGELVE
jgi:hypothetical protein